MPELQVETSSTTTTTTAANSAEVESLSQQIKNQLNLESDNTNLSYDAPPFVPRSVITETKLLQAFKNNVVSSDFDSGCDTSAKSKSEPEDIPFVKPDEALTKQIIDQVEFYFSDENIVKDAFLLKHVKRNKEGFVSLKLISSFKRVKHLSKDWRVVAFALAKSEKLQINDQGTKIRRVNPLPAFDQTTPSRTIVAINITSELATIENVAEMFKPCGEIALIRVLRPGNPIPSDVRHFVNKHPEMNGNINALIEFVRTESAHNAIQKTDWAAGMTVIELNAPSSKVKRERVPKKLSTIRHHVFNDSTDYSTSCASGSESDTKYIQRRISTPQMFSADGNHWVQRKWSRDSGSDSPGSNFSRSRSNSGAGYYIPPDRRLSLGWDSSSSEYSSARSRSNSGASMDMRRFSTSSRDSNGECCCCTGHNNTGQGHRSSITHNESPMNQERRFSFTKQPSTSSFHHHNSSVQIAQPSGPGPHHHHHHDNNGYRKDSGGSDCYVTRSRSNSNSGPNNGFSNGNNGFSNNGFERRVSFSDNFRPRTSSSSSNDSFTMRRLSFTRDPNNSGATVCQQRAINNVPENLVRLPRGPDGSRGFQLCDYSIHE